MERAGVGVEDRGGCGVSGICVYARLHLCISVCLCLCLHVCVCARHVQSSQEAICFLLLNSKNQVGCCLSNATPLGTGTGSMHDAAVLLSTVACLRKSHDLHRMSIGFTCSALRASPRASPRASHRLTDTHNPPQPGPRTDTPPDHTHPPPQPGPQ